MRLNNCASAPTMRMSNVWTFGQLLLLLGNASAAPALNVKARSSQLHVGGGSSSERWCTGPSTVPAERVAFHKCSAAMERPATESPTRAVPTPFSRQGH